MDERSATQASAVADLLEQLCRQTYSASFSAGLNPAQWAALRYLSRAAPVDRTAGAFARHHATTKGTATQTVAALRRKGHVVQSILDDDRRVRSLDLTESGRRILQEDPAALLVAAVECMPVDECHRLRLSLESIMRALRVLRSGGR